MQQYVTEELPEALRRIFKEELKRCSLVLEVIQYGWNTDNPRGVTRTVEYVLKGDQPNDTGDRWRFELLYVDGDESVLTNMGTRRDVDWRHVVDKDAIERLMHQKFKSALDESGHGPIKVSVCDERYRVVKRGGLWYSECHIETLRSMSNFEKLEAHSEIETRLSSRPSRLEAEGLRALEHCIRFTKPDYSEY